MALRRLGTALALAALPTLAAGCLTGQGRTHLDRDDVADCLRDAGAVVSESPVETGPLAPSAYEGALGARFGAIEVVLLFERNETEAAANEEAARLAAIAEGLPPGEASRVVGSRGNVTWYWTGRRNAASADAVERCVGDESD